MKKTPLSILQQYWGYPQFRPLQHEIISAVLEGNDVLALLPTGGGKSICFQVPALAQDGLCLVISPLIALMKDQVEGLRRKGITAFSLFSGMRRKEVIHTLQTAGNSNCKFLYVSPERLETSLFREYLPSLGVSLIAVDEAHCISQWGYDFRPPYLRIAQLREELPNVPVLALTASATPEVQEDICHKLNFRKEKLFRQSFARPNLSFSVFDTPVAIHKISEILAAVPGSGIVYCRSRKRTRDIAELLNRQGIPAGFYHAGLSQAERNQRQEDWIQNKTRVMVCTNAFGMGIDKPDVRSVIHADVPDCLENYYQEAGRAGRDGKKAYAVLCYNARALDDLESLAERRFPPLDEMKPVYQALMNYLQVPAGAGGETYYEFDLAAFLERFGFAASLVTATLQTLDQENHLSFNEQVFLPARLQFVCSRARLFSVEEEFPRLEPLVKALLRNYEGIIDFPVALYEPALARLLNISLDDLTLQLQQLQHLGMVEYQPQRDKPQVYFHHPRVPVESLVLNAARYRERRQRFEERVQELLSYVRKENVCRSRMLAGYFGDLESADCGICDNCLRKKKNPLGAEEFEHIRQRIMEALKSEPSQTPILLQKTTGVGKEKLQTVLHFLIAEDRLQVDDAGNIHTKR